MSGGLSEADIERMKNEAEANASSDAAVKERLLKANENSRKIQTMKSTIEPAANIPDKANVLKAIEQALAVTNNEKSTVKQIDEAYNNLKKIVDPVLTAAYHNSASANASTEPNRE